MSFKEVTEYLNLKITKSKIKSNKNNQIAQTFKINIICSACLMMAFSTNNTILF